MAVSLKQQRLATLEVLVRQETSLDKANLKAKLQEQTHFLERLNRHITRIASGSTSAGSSCGEDSSSDASFQGGKFCD